MSDLSSPLGFKAPVEDRKRLPVGVIMSVLVATMLVLLGLWLMIVDTPFGGQPVAIAKIEDMQGPISREEITTVGVKSGSGELLPPATAESGKEPVESAVTTHSTDGTEGPAKLVIVADPALQQTGTYGTMPKIADDGRKPMDVYARPVPGYVGASPKIAIIVGGLGLSQTGTQDALKQLPPEVTLAFAPYGSSLDRWQERAREDGHEMLLQIPLEPFDYPDNDPGPHTLLTSLDADKNLDRLHWLMTRISTYVGVIGYMGARFTADGAALDPLMGELKQRGLLYVDDGSSSRSIAEAGAKTKETAFARADLVIDQVTTQPEIVGRLAQLEQIARQRGIAVGFASALPVSVGEISKWAKTLEARGITLVPVSATQHAD